MSATEQNLLKTEKSHISSLSLTSTASLTSSAGDSKQTVEETKIQGDKTQTTFDRKKLPPDWVILEGDFDKLVPEDSQEFVLLEWRQTPTATSTASAASADTTQQPVAATLASALEVKTEGESKAQAEGKGDSKNKKEDRQLLRVLITRCNMESVSECNSSGEFFIENIKYILDKGIKGKISLFFMLGNPTNLRGENEVNTFFSNCRAIFGFSPENFGDFELTDIPQQAKQRLMVPGEYLINKYQGCLMGGMRPALFKECFAKFVSEDLFRSKAEQQYFEHLCQSYGLAEPFAEETMLIQRMQAALNSGKYAEAIKLARAAHEKARLLENKTIIKFLNKHQLPIDTRGYFIIDQCDAALTLGQQLEEMSLEHTLEAYNILDRSDLFLERPIDSQFWREAQIAAASVARKIAEKSKSVDDIKRSLAINLRALDFWDIEFEKRNQLFDLWLKEFGSLCGFNESDIAEVLLRNAKIHFQIYFDRDMDFTKTFMSLILPMAEKIYALKAQKNAKLEKPETKIISEAVYSLAREVSKETAKVSDMNISETKNADEETKSLTEVQSSFSDIPVLKDWKKEGEFESLRQSDSTSTVVYSKIVRPTEESFKEKPQLVNVIFKRGVRWVNGFAFSADGPKVITMSIIFAQPREGNKCYYSLEDKLPGFRKHAFFKYFKTESAHIRAEGFHEWCLALSIDMMRSPVCDELFLVLKQLNVFNEAEVLTFKSICQMYGIHKHSKDEYAAISKIEAAVKLGHYSDAIEIARSIHEQSRKIENGDLIRDMNQSSRLNPRFSDQCDIAYDLGSALQEISPLHALEAFKIVTESSFRDLEVDSYYKREAIDKMSSIFRFLASNEKGIIADRKSYAEAILLLSKMLALPDEEYGYSFQKFEIEDAADVHSNMLLMLENFCGFTDLTKSTDRVFSSADLLSEGNVDYPKLLFKMGLVVRGLLGKGNELQKKDGMGDAKGKMEGKLLGEASFSKALSFDPKAPGSPKASNMQSTAGTLSAGSSAGAAGAASDGASLSASAAARPRRGSTGLTTVLSLDED